MEQTELEKQIGELELALDRLRSLYEQYFVGIEKIVPAVPRKDVDRKLHALRKEQIRNTALRFRFQMVLQRYNTYQTHWQRVCREIENGTYKRHMVRAQRRFGSTRPPPRGTAPPIVRPEPGDALPRDLLAQLAERDRDFEAPSFDIDIPIDVDQPSSRRPPVGPGPAVRPPANLPPAGVPPFPSPQRPGSPASPAPPRPAAPVWKKVAIPGAPAPPHPAPPPAGPPPPVRAAPPRPGPPSVAPVARPPPPASPELPEARMRQIYAEYLDVKRRQNESTAAISYQSVAKSLRESGDRLRQKHGKPVDFEVTVKDGKTILRPVLK